jgi:hypothetical protein
MSHLDDGTLHAYLDGELGSTERERLEGHLAGCPPCRERLAEERALVERAERLLGLAAPPAPTRAAPPLHGLRRRPAWWRARVPLVWAATLALALGAGWLLRGRTMAPSQTTVLNRPVPTVATTTRPVSEAVASASPVDMPRGAAERVPTPAGASAATRAPDAAIVYLDPAVAAKAAAQRPQARPASTLPEEVGRISAQVVTAAPAAPLALEEAASDRSDRTRRSATWTVIGPTSARALLGADPAAIPGQPIRALRRGPGPTPEIVVEQELGSGVVVLLFERTLSQEGAGDPSERMVQGGAAPANERLARFVRSLRVEIAGPLPADSLSRLLESVR